MNVFAPGSNLGSGYGRLTEWIRLTAVSVGGQVLAQGIGFLSGILIIRLLSIQEYVYYTLANTTLATMIVLADSGISTGVMAEGGKVWPDRQKLGIVLATGLEIRKRLSVAGLIIGMPFVVWLLQQHGADLLITGLIVLAIVLSFLTTLNANLLDIVPKLHQDIIPLQGIHAKANIGRLGLLVMGLFFFPFAFVAIVLTNIPQLWANTRLFRLSKLYVAPGQRSDREVARKIKYIVKRHFPSALFFCLSGQITIWLLSIFGSTLAVAQVGALGRLSMIMNVCTMIVYTLVLPRFARMPNDKSFLLRRFIQIQTVLWALVAAVLLLVWVFSAQLLWVIGTAYAGLEDYLMWIMATSCLSFISGCLFYLCMSRGWVLNPLYSIAISVCSIIAGCLFFQLSATEGVLKLNFFIAGVNAAVYMVYGLVCINRQEPEPVLQSAEENSG